MAFKLLPRTRENTTTVGTGNITLTGAVAPNNLTFGAQMSDGDQTFACALSSDGLTWEEGLYTMSSGQLVRTATLATSALDTSPVSLNGGRVFAIVPHDMQALFEKIFEPSNDGEMLAWDAGLGRFAMRFAGGRTWHHAVALATAEALPSNTYDNGSAGIGATLTATSNGALTVDGVAVTADYRILVKDEATPAYNGIYIVTATGDGSNPFVLTRAPDHDDAIDINQSDTVIVGTAGASNALTVWVSTIDFPFTLGTSDIVWQTVASQRGLYSGSLSLIPTISGTGLTSWINQGTASASDGANGILLSSAGAANDQMRFIYKAAPTAPFKVRALISADLLAQHLTQVGLLFYDGTNKLHGIFVNYDNSGGVGFAVYYFSTPSAYAGQSGAGLGFLGHAFPISLYIENDGTDIKFGYSSNNEDDGDITLYSDALASPPYLGASGYSNIGFGFNMHDDGFNKGKFMLHDFKVIT